MNNGYNQNRNGRQMPPQRQGQPPRQGQRPMGQGGQVPPQGQARQNYTTDPGIKQRRPGSASSPGRNQPKQPGPGRSVRSGRQMPSGGQQIRLNMEQSRSDFGRQQPRRQTPVNNRKATKEQMRQENRRRRKEAFSVFLSRLALYGVLLLIVGGIVAGGFFLFFYNTPDENKSSVTYFESYDGKHTEKYKISENIAYPDGVLFVNFSNIADGCDMSVIKDSENVKFVFPDGEDTADSSGTGHEEYALFAKKSTECVVCGQDARLTAPAVFSGGDVWIPADFVSSYMNGITVNEEKADGKVYISRDSKGEGDKMKLEEVSFKLKAITAPEPTEPTDDVQVTGEMPEVEFTTDLSAFEQYMNPENAAEYLVLVNKITTVDESYAPTDLTNVVDTRQDGRDTQQMRLTAAKALEAMFIEMRAAGYTDVSVTSAYRSYKYQNELYTTYTNNEMANNPALTKEQAQAIVDTYSAKPGTSEHQTGLCCDLHNLPGADVSFAEERAYDWLCENAWKFGFILRFPEDKTEITRYSFEPWHYRFVGRNAAWMIHNGGLCLEEYLAG